MARSGRARRLIGCLYVPNGNPAPDPKCDYKLRWFERLASYASQLIALNAPVSLLVTTTSCRQNSTSISRNDGLMMRCFALRCGGAFHSLIAQGWTDALRTLHPNEEIYTFWDYFVNAWGRNAGLRIDHVLLSPSLAGRLEAADVDRPASSPT